MAHREDLRLLYCCEVCAENNPEMCGHFDRKQLRVANDGTWLCEGCWDEAEADVTGDISFADSMFIPPKYRPPRESSERIYK